MALSFDAVKKAYLVFNEIKTTVLPGLLIPAWPSDMATWSTEEKMTAPTLQVLGWSRKADDGWENLFFLVKDPSPQLIEKFNELKSRVPHTSLEGEFQSNKKLQLFGWF